MRFSIFLTLSVLVAVSACSSDPDADSPPTAAVLEARHIKAVGGEKALARLTNRVIEGRWIDDRPTLGAPVEKPLKAWANAEGHWRMQIGDEVFGCDARGGWHLDSSGVQADAWHDRSKLGFILDPQGFLNLDQYFMDRCYERQQTIEYRRLSGVFTDRDSSYYTLWFDSADDLLFLLGYHYQVKDYREVDGVLVPHHVEAGRKGGANHYLFDTILHNQDIPDSLLARPGSG